jgi:hypothetical protein
MCWEECVFLSYMPSAFFQKISFRVLNLLDICRVSISVRHICIHSSMRMKTCSDITQENYSSAVTTELERFLPLLWQRLNFTVGITLSYIHYM